MEIGFKIKGVIGTEARFAVRKWFSEWVEAVNSGNLDYWQSDLAESLTVTDLQAQELSKSGFVRYLTAGQVELLIPSVTLSKEAESYHLAGEWEVLQDGMVVFNGLFELIAKKVEDDSFKMFGITFFPRLRLDVIS